MARTAVPKRTRFEVFKRDSFTCQYCGRRAPDVVLQLDHIEPVSEGGSNDILNLTTSCKECNAGKSDKRLSDDSALVRQRAQLDELQQRREQSEMLIRWKRELLSQQDSIAAQLAEYWSELTHPFVLNDEGLDDLARLARKFGPEEIMDAMQTSVDQYVKTDGQGQPTKDSVNKAWDYVRRILRFTPVLKKKPYLKDLLYIRGILRNRFSYVSEPEAMQLLETAAESGVDIYRLRALATRAQHWSDWRLHMEELIDESLSELQDDAEELADG